jgi:isobutyryl-CoA dehydrogenase
MQCYRQILSFFLHVPSISLIKRLSKTGTVVDKSHGLTDDQQMLLSMAENFAASELAPRAAEWDEKHIMPLEVLKKAGELGFGGMYVREDVGGTGLSRLDTSIVLEALSTADVSTTAYISIHNMVCTCWTYRYKNTFRCTCFSASSMYCGVD